jgi:dipeptidase E
MRLLLLSNSTNAGQAYLQHALPYIKSFVRNDDKNNALFIPYASVMNSYHDYEKMVIEKFSEINIPISSVHHFNDPVAVIKRASLIVVGGGNTFQLLSVMQHKSLVESIRQKVQGGTPYIGWSAGANVACPTIRTTNDMPVVQPESFNALNLIPFQINPHYLDKNPEGHAGETREMRIQEFLKINPDNTVVGLREGTLLQLVDSTLSYMGNKPMRIFIGTRNPIEMNQGEDPGFLLHPAIDIS